MAELDRAKTQFFTNISHEFRTPLMLSVVPVDDALTDAAHPLPKEQRERLEIAHRNQLRLLKLVNTLLDFSRIEASRTQAAYEPTDLAAYTAELAGVFRSAIERANLRLIVDCAPLPDPIHVDREMWEKIVLNLISNALKFTFEGEIAIALRGADDRVELEVRDTGVGIPEAELSRIFERFHRVADTRARTHEGSGIGLSLVRELVRLHAGTVRVHSLEGRGTTFIVSIPRGLTHLPPDHGSDAGRQGSNALGTLSFVEEALRWLPSRQEDVIAPIVAHKGDVSDESLCQTSERSARILVADDNADLRDYLGRLLHTRYDVEMAANGREALDIARELHPDLILADVMMPVLDGFGLLRELREDPHTSTIPVIILSARAGEDSRVEGMGVGADDYLVKPFSARELLARVEAHLKLARLREAAARAVRESEERLRLALSAGNLGYWELDLTTNALDLSDTSKAIFGHPPSDSFTLEDLFEAIHPDDRDRARSTLRASIDGRIEYDDEYRAVWPDGSIHWIDARGRAFNAVDGRPARMLGVTLDVTARRRAKEMGRLLSELRTGRSRLETLSRRLVVVQEAERRRLARELHDEIGQILTGLSLTLEMTARLPAAAIGPRLSEARSLVGDLLGRVRQLSLDLRPTMLDDLGLVPALLWHVERYTTQTGIRVDFRHAGLDRRYSPDLETAIFRIAQEALTNVARHAAVSTVRVRVRADDRTLKLQIADRGVGFDPRATRGTSGVVGMQERAGLIGGRLRLESGPRMGTRLVVTVPLSAAEPSLYSRSDDLR